MQSQGELGVAKVYKNSFDCFVQMYQKGGIRALQMGLVPGILYQVAMNGTRLGCYDPMKEWLGVNDPQKKHSFVRTIAAAAAVGSIGASVGSPFFLIKVRCQVEASKFAVAVGTQHSYGGKFWTAVRSIYHRDGIAGFFNG
ncbi:hypothetical protein RFI_20491, partial [Reticulomyxa filosa]